MTMNFLLQPPAIERLLTLCAATIEHLPGPQAEAMVDAMRYFETHAPAQVWGLGDPTDCGPLLDRGQVRHALNRFLRESRSSVWDSDWELMRKFVNEVSEDDMLRDARHLRVEHAAGVTLLPVTECNRFIEELGPWNDGIRAAFEARTGQSSESIEVDPLQHYTAEGEPINPEPGVTAAHEIQTSSDPATAPQSGSSTVYLAEGVKTLLSVAEALLASEDNTGCDPSLTVVESAPIEALRAAAAKVAAQERKIVVGVYDHVHGNNEYLFALAPGEALTPEDFVAYIASQGIDFEPDREFVRVSDEAIIDLGGQVDAPSVPASTAAPSTRYHLVHIEGDVEPGLVGTFETYEALLIAARELKQKKPRDGLYYIRQIGTAIEMECFIGVELDLEEAE